MGIKQTAIEWAEDEMSKLYSEAGNITLSEYHKKRVALWEQAKEMQKEQMIEISVEATSHAYDEIKIFGVDPRPYSKKRAEQYYNETYGKEGNENITS